MHPSDALHMHRSGGLADLIELANDGDLVALEGFLFIMTGRLPERPPAIPGDSAERDLLIEGTYAQILFFDLQKDWDSLGSLIQDLRPLCGRGRSSLLPASLVHVAELKLGIASQTIDISLADSLTAQNRMNCLLHEEEIWRGECAFIAATAYRALGKRARSQELFGRAARLLEAGGAARKAALATRQYFFAA